LLCASVSARNPNSNAQIMDTMQIRDRLSGKHIRGAIQRSCSGTDKRSSDWSFTQIAYLLTSPRWIESIGLRHATMLEYRTHCTCGSGLAFYAALDDLFTAVSNWTTCASDWDVLWISKIDDRNHVWSWFYSFLSNTNFRSYK